MLLVTLLDFSLLRDYLFWIRPRERNTCFIYRGCKNKDHICIENMHFNFINKCCVLSICRVKKSSPYKVVKKSIKTGLALLFKRKRKIQQFIKAAECVRLAISWSSQAVKFSLSYNLFVNKRLVLII